MKKKHIILTGPYVSANWNKIFIPQASKFMSIYLLKINLLMKKTSSFIHNFEDEKDKVKKEIICKGFFRIRLRHREQYFMMN